MKRRIMRNKSLDRRKFRHTAMSTNKVNIAQLTARGGTRL